MRNFSQHPSLTLNRDIAAICAPILTQPNYHIFNFIRVYNDNQVLYLCDNQEWLKIYLTNKYPAIGAFEQHTEFRKHDYVLWNALSDQDPIVIYSRVRFNIKFGITLVQPFKDGYDFFNFGSAKNDCFTLHAIENEVEMLQKFSQTFYNKAKNLIAKTARQPLNILDFTHGPTSSDLNLSKTTTKLKLCLGPKYDYAHLTAKEILYLRHLLTGATIPQLANQNNTSVRTIEKHIENIKSKLRCKTQYELGYLAGKLEVDSFDT